MKQIVVKTKVDGDGVLRLHLPVGEDEADKEVQVTVDCAPVTTMTQEEYREFILSTAGKWQGDFERPDQGEYEEREPLS